MKFTLPSIAVMAATASAAAVDLAKRDSPLSVTLTKVEDSKVKVALTNNAEEGYNLMFKETFLDDAPSDKLIVSSKSTRAPFIGIYQRMATSDLPEEVFKTIAAGETIEVEIELAEIYELAESGSYDVSAAGNFLYAPVNSTELTGEVLSYSSESISVDVVYEKAHTISKAVDKMQKRTIVQSDCTGTRRTATVNALSNCRSLAVAAASAASSGAAARMTEFFKSSTTATRNTVATVFNRIATECGSSTSGVSRQYCTDIYPACSSGVIAYTLPSQSYMVNCPYYFSSFPAQSRTCRAIDQATTTLHEVTHLTQIRGTQDYNCYGYNCVRSLSASQNLNHADTYTLFAQSIYAGC